MWNLTNISNTIKAGGRALWTRSKPFVSAISRSLTRVAKTVIRPLKGGTDRLRNWTTSPSTAGWKVYAVYMALPTTTLLTLLAYVWPVVLWVYAAVMILLLLWWKFHATLFETEPDRVGVYFTVYGWNLIARPLVSTIVGTLYATPILLLDLAAGSHVMTVWLSAGLIFILALWVGLDDTDEPEVVPEAHAAMLTLLRRRFRWYRTEGEYNWTGKRAWLGRSTTVHVDSDGKVKEGIHKDGFIRITPFPISIWNQVDQKGKVLLESLSSVTSQVFNTLTLTIQLFDPKLWLDSPDPVLDLAEQAREAFRTVVSFFTGKDVSRVKKVLGTMMLGKTIITVFTPKNIGYARRGTMIWDRAGVPMFEVVENGLTEAQVEEKKVAFRDRLDREANPDALKACKFKGPQDATEVVHIEVRTVEGSFKDVLERLGAGLVKAAVGNIQLSEEEMTEGNKAASEESQAEAQIASANATAEGIKIVNEAAAKASDLSVAIAASKDYPGVRVAVIGGGKDDLRSAAATHATLANASGDNT